MSRALHLLGIALVTGCADGGAAAPMTVRDSAGVTIVESMAPRWQPGEEWQVDSVPLLDLGGDGGPAFEFDGLADALRLPDGSVVVADFGSREIRRFGPDGHVQWVMGREGEGPGEFNRIRNLTRFRNDSLLVWDFWLGRGTVLSQDGSVGRVFRLTTLGRADRLYPLDDSTLVAVFVSLELMDRDGSGLAGAVPGDFREWHPDPLAGLRCQGGVAGRRDTAGPVPGQGNRGGLRPGCGPGRRQRRARPGAAARSALTSPVGHPGCPRGPSSGSIPPDSGTPSSCDFGIYSVYC